MSSMLQFLFSSLQQSNNLPTMNRSNLFFLCFVCLATFTRCNEVVPIEIEEAPRMFVIDAWVNNLPEEQMIKLSYTQPYFEPNQMEGIENGFIYIESQNNPVRRFLHRGNGEYIWTPKNGERIGAIGDEFRLFVAFDNQLFIGLSTMNPAPKIDSIVQRLRRNQLNNGDGIYAQFFAKDLPGQGDAYWIKTYKNGVFLNKPSELNIAFDAGVDFGANIDGVTFIPTIRDMVNRVPDENDPLGDMIAPPYERGDSIHIEIHSLTLEAFRFLKVAKNQTNRANNAIFSIPHANPRGNIINTLNNELAIGMFCVSAVEQMGKRIK